jgi:hypothetical protein
MKKILILCLILSSSLNGWTQNTINDYKYVVVPLQYDFLKGQNTYRLNTLTKVLFKQHGFDVHFEKSDLPKDLFDDRCLAMYADVHKVKGGFRKTKLEITLKDCRGEVIMTSDVGQSGENNHEKRHQIALRDAFNSIKKLNYKYQPNSSSTQNASLNKEKKVEKEIVKTEVEETIEKIEKVDEVDEVEDKSIAARKEEVKSIETKIEKEKIASKKISNVLYAIPIKNGYQVRDEAKNNMMVLLKTAAKNVYTVKGKSAIVFKENDKWMYSENDGSSSVLKELNIKF